jgi:hypothetical protein
VIRATVWKLGVNYLRLNQGGVMRYQLLALFAIFGTGCIIGSNTPVDHHDGAGGSLPASATMYKIQSGGSSTLNVGTQVGYAITATSTIGGPGATYQVVWTGDAAASGTYHEFWGTIWSTGKLSSLNGVTLEADDFLSPIRTDSSGAARVDWDTFASDGIDGFTVVTDTEPVIFDFYIEGLHYPNYVFFPDGSNGGTVSSVSAFPFGMNTH